MKTRIIIKILGVGFFGVPVCVAIGEILEMDWAGVMMLVGLLIFTYFYVEKD